MTKAENTIKKWGLMRAQINSPMTDSTSRKTKWSPDMNKRQWHLGFLLGVELGGWGPLEKWSFLLFWHGFGN